MKFLVIISAFVACAAAQVPYPGFANGPYATAYAAPLAYAPAFGYGTFGTPAAPKTASGHSRTALDVFHPYAFNNAYYAHNLYYNNFHPYGFAAPVVAAAAPAPAAVAVEAASPVVKAVEAPAAVVVDEADAVEVVEADPNPIVPVGPVHIRNIFPIFGSDLRDSNEGIVFARPDQIIPVKPVVTDEAQTLPAVISPDFSRSFASSTYHAGFPYAGFAHPRFFAAPRAFATPVIAA